MAKKLEDFAQDQDKEDDEEAVKRRQREKKVCYFRIPIVWFISVE